MAREVGRGRGRLWERLEEVVALGGFETGVQDEVLARFHQLVGTGHSSSGRGFFSRARRSHDELLGRSVSRTLDLVWHYNLLDIVVKNVRRSCKSHCGNENPKDATARSWAKVTKAGKPYDT